MVSDFLNGVASIDINHLGGLKLAVFYRRTIISGVSNFLTNLKNNTFFYWLMMLEKRKNILLISFEHLVQMKPPSINIRL